MSIPDSAEQREAILQLLADHYGLSGSLTRLPGENRNFLVEDEEGRQSVLKVADDNIPTTVVEMEYAALEHAAAGGVALSLPRIIKTRRGQIEAIDGGAGGEAIRARLLRFVSGSPWCELAELTEDLLADLGRQLAAFDCAMQHFEHPAMRRSHRWNLAEAGQHRRNISLVTERGRRDLLERAFHLWAACALPVLPSLPWQFIHGDANDENVMVENNRVAGLLDFGDCGLNPTICELAICLAYIMLEQNEPLAAGARVVAGYNALRPLDEGERSVLFPLVCGRLAVTCATAAERRRLDPDHPNWFVTEDKAWRLLERLLDVPPDEARSALAAHIETGPAIRHGSDPEDLLARRKEHIGPSLSLAHGRPLKMVKGRGQYLYDDKGRPYLDMVNNPIHVGYCHPRVNEAARRQMWRLNTNTRYLYDGLTDYAERLCATLPDPLTVCYLVNSGSEANELALRLARTHTRREDFVVVDGAYHGHTANLVALSPYKFMGKGGKGKPEPWVHVAPMPDGYRGKFRGQGRDAGVAYGNEVGRVIADAGRRPIAGFICEPVLSCGGQIVPPDGYLETAFAHVREAGGLGIADEVQVGFGRVGTHFWAFEMQGVVPDIVVMGKPIGNGHPMAAVVTTREIADSFDNGMEWFSTFGGNPVSCAIGMAVLDVIESESLQQRALELGGRLVDGLGDLKGKHALIGDVRGAGLFAGMELVRNRETLEPAADQADAVVQRMRERGILLSTDGPLHNVIKFKPPMVLNDGDVDMVVRCLDDVLHSI